MYAKVCRHLGRTFVIGILFGSGALLADGYGTLAEAQEIAVRNIGNEMSAPVPTFSQDIAPIIQTNCAACHRPGGVAPMALTSYEEVRPWAPLIKLRTEARKMPPWPIDTTVGIQEFKNDHSLSSEQIRLIGRWADAGAPLGNAADLPVVKAWPEYGDRWTYQDRHFNRPPDLVIQSPVMEVKANGGDLWPDPESLVTGLNEPRWIRAIEIRPADPESRYVFHHANPSLTQDGENVGLVQTAVGTEGFIFPADAGLLIKPGATVSWGMHLYPVAEDVDAVMEIGLWFYDEAPRFESPGEVLYEIAQFTGSGASGDARGHSLDPQFVRRGDLIIPPHSLATYKGVYVLDRPARIHSLRGHAHLRGKFQMVEAIHPDGTYEMINKLNWDHPWHTAFLYEDHAMPLLPKGTVIMLTSVFDNTVANPYNPDPDQWVVAGDRTVDEMSHLRFGITYFDNEADFQELVRKRDALREALEESNN